MLVTRLDETIVAGMVVLLHRCRTARLASALYCPPPACRSRSQTVTACWRFPKEGEREPAGGGRPVMRDLGYFSEFAVFIIFLRNRKSAPTH
jgi:hypothetical protein